MARPQSIVGVQLSIRDYVLEHPDCSMAELALAFDITLNAAKMHTRQLTKKGAIKRDGRTWAEGDGLTVAHASEAPRQRTVDTWEEVKVKRQQWYSALGL